MSLRAFLSQPTLVAIVLKMLSIPVFPFRQLAAKNSFDFYRFRAKTLLFTNQTVCMESMTVLSVGIAQNEH